MSDTDVGVHFGGRLHRLKEVHGLTLQEMAERCGLPKSTLESYMKAIPKKPGLEALLAIANGFDVSLDWLVGRAATDVSIRLTLNDYALACYNAVQEVLKEEANGSADYETFVSQISARAMLNFKENVHLYDRTDKRYGADRRDFAALVAELAGRYFDPEK